MTTDTAPRTVSTDPGWYTEPHQIRGTDPEVLREVRTNAQHTYATCGGHRLAAQMQRTIRLIDAEIGPDEIEGFETFEVPC